MSDNRSHGVRAKARAKPTVVGAGFLALDVIFNVDTGGPARCFAGGTCGNLVAILSYLGWNSVPVGRLGPGRAAERVLEDLQQWGVSSDFVSREAGGTTPVIIERIGKSPKGEPYHRFSWRCPSCGAYLPGYKPVLASAAQDIKDCLPRADVFFFDRVSRGVLLLAEACAKSGAIVVFEPSGIGDPGLFRQAWRLAHVVKYSHSQLRDLADLDLTQNERDSVLLEVETLGAEGLRYRSRLAGSRTRGWLASAPYKTEALRDAAGAGDWCTAGLLDQIGRHGLAGVMSASGDDLRNAIRHGQALATWTCEFEGARGGMYEVDKTAFRAQVRRLASGANARAAPKGPAEPVEELLPGRLCVACDEAVTAFSTKR